MHLPTLRAEVARYAKKMYDSQLVHATQGNLSTRDPQSGLICITPSGADYQLLTAEDIVEVPETTKWEVAQRVLDQVSKLRKASRLTH